MSLATPESVRKLQSGLGTKAKNEPAFRFYQLYDKVYRPDILAHAYALSKSKNGAAGVDGVTFESIEASGAEEWLASLGKALHGKTYEPSAVRRVMIPKPGGGERPLGIPTVRDRVAQTAVALVIGPIFEADLEPNAHGYRPGHSAPGAVEKVKEALNAGMTEVVDADLSRYFDTIPHDQLMKSLARRISDSQMLALIKAWLKVPVEERNDRDRPRMSGGKDATCGVPQGGPLSPLLANIYINRLLKAFARVAGRYDEALVNYADDFVILSRGRARGALGWLRRVLPQIGLTLNEGKTSVRDALSETFDFLGFTLGRQPSQRTGQMCFPSRPSRRSIRRFRDNIHQYLRRNINEPWCEVALGPNRKIRGWAAYFHHGVFWAASRALNRFVAERVRTFLRRRHKVSTCGTRRFGRREVYSTLGVVSLESLAKAARS